MKVKVYVIELPAWVGRLALPVLVCGLALLVWRIARAAVPNTFSPGQLLTAQALNDNFKAVATPPGTVVAYAGDPATPPSGWLLCDGASIDISIYPALAAALGTRWGTVDGQHVNLPDLRGRFLRGFSAGSARDPDCNARTASNANGATGCAVGTLQADDFATHTHFILTNASAGGSNASLTVQNATGSGGTGAAGGSETRPKNAAVTYLVKT